MPSPLSHHLGRYFSTDAVPGPSGSGSLTQVPYQAFPAEDDWNVVAAFNQRMWRGFCGAVGHPEWERDPRAVLRSLGYGDTEVEGLEARGVVGAAAEPRKQPAPRPTAA